MDEKMQLPTSAPLKRFDWESFISRYGTVVALIVIFVVFALLESRFVSSRNLINILRQVSTLAVVAGGLTICIAAGEFDLSIGAVASLAGILVAGLMVRQAQPFPVALIAVLVVGVVFGLGFALIVTVFKVPSLIATIGGASVALGVNFAYAGGDSIYGNLPESYEFIGQGFVGPLPMTVILAGIVIVLLYLFLNYTKTGRYIIATGANPTAAKLSGINTNLYRTIALVISSVGAVLAGVMLTSYQGSAQPQALDAYTLDSLAAVFLGMTTIRRGQANILGTVIGVLTLGILSNGLNMVGAPFFVKEIVRGGVLVLAVLLAVRREEIRFF